LNDRKGGRERDGAVRIGCGEVRGEDVGSVKAAVDFRLTAEVRGQPLIANN